MEEASIIGRLLAKEPRKWMSSCQPLISAARNALISIARHIGSLSCAIHHFLG